MFSKQGSSEGGRERKLNTTNEEILDLVRRDEVLELTRENDEGTTNRFRGGRRRR